jgi:hypothetical protein
MVIWLLLLSLLLLLLQVLESVEPPYSEGFSRSMLGLMASSKAVQEASGGLV